MYEIYFNLNERPFASVPRSDHYFAGAVIENARATLARCVTRAEGVAIVAGPSGTGKSLLCQILAEQFQREFQVALLAGAHLDTRRSLLQAILYELGQPYRGMDEGELRLALVDYVTLSENCQRGIVLLVDEAQHLPLRLLDEIRTLTNLMRGMQPAVRLLMTGSHALEERFASPKLESFSQRISARCYLEAFQRHETQNYIYARIAACGGRGAEIFPENTCHMVHKATDGVPRLINQVCDHVMLLAYAAGIRTIEPQHVDEAWSDLQQLPMPWNAAVPKTPDDSVIEFGGLDDEPLLSVPETAQSLAADEDAVPGIRIASQTRFDAADDGEDGQLEQIQDLLADVRAEFLPFTGTQPEAELVFEAPRSFAEKFAEEEVVADRYTEIHEPVQRPVEPGPDVASMPAAVLSAQKASPSIAAVQQESSVPMYDRETHWPATAEPSRQTAVAANAGMETREPAARSVVPPPRREFGRLFAKLRRGL